MTTADSTTSWAQWIKFYASNMYYAGVPMLFWVKPQWHVESMGSQAGKTILITGGNSGTGYATAKEYYERGARVIIACRSAERANAAVEDIKKGGEMNILGKMVYTPLDSKPVGQIESVELDLADLNSVEKCAQELLAKESKLDIFFANAGIMALPPGSFTKQGYSLQFGTNVLGHQQLISRLLPLLQKTTRADPANPARLLMLSSAAHVTAPPGGVDYSTLKKGDKLLGEWTEYGESKWGDLALAKYVDKHYGPRSGNPDGEVVSIAIHPGLVRTNLYAHLSIAEAIAAKFPFLLNLMNVAPITGALNQIWAGQLPVEEAKEISGKYVVPYQVIATHRPDLNDPAKWEQLWNWCNEQAKRAE